ncbi:MAG: hypothetical protein NVS4B11_26160 [Ktedonobacteraceae bacterium]
MADTAAIEVNLYINVEKDNDLVQTAQLIEERFGQLEMVKEVEAVGEKARFTGLEIVGVIGVTVLVVRGSRELIEELRKLIPQLKELISEIKGLKEVFVEVKDKHVPIAEVKEETLQQLATKS